MQGHIGQMRDAADVSQSILALLRIQQVYRHVSHVRRSASIGGRLESATTSQPCRDPKWRTAAVPAIPVAPAIMILFMAVSL